MKKAFGMIEAITTIVLLGIVFATIPWLLNAAKDSEALSLEGEALYHASSLITKIASMPFNSLGYSAGDAFEIDGEPGETFILNFAGSGCGMSDMRAGTSSFGATRYRHCQAGGGTPGWWTPDGIKNAATVTEQIAVNEWNGYTQVFEQGFSLEVAIDYLNYPVDPTPIPDTFTWTTATSGWTTSVAATNQIMIAVTAKDRDGEAIGTLRYLVSNIGATR
ncbi:MAG: hypothetical protein LBN32_05025 [Helicobacteraceae bacterium]|jgi:hypothetical protein|nr:hypothetical protein [Helicobacteraceae bacterium]